MTLRTPDDDTRERAGWLVDQIQTLAINAPEVLRAAERVVREVIAAHLRQTIAERLEGLDSEGLTEVNAFVSVVARSHGDDPPLSS